jgi:RNAse (barnase) inhibitor barstar
MKHKIRLNGKHMLDKHSALDHLSKRFDLMHPVHNLDALWDELSTLHRIQKITLIHVKELYAYDDGQKVLKLLIDYVHMKEVTFEIK